MVSCRHLEEVKVYNEETAGEKEYLFFLNITLKNYVECEII